MADPEFISIIDCALCRVIPWSDNASESGPLPDKPPLPPSWASLSTVAVLSPGFRSPWGNRAELRMCPSCGTYYEYRQDHDSGDNDPFSSVGTCWYLSRLTPHGAATLMRRAQPPQTRSAPGNAKRRYPHIIQALRSDLARVQNEASFTIKHYVVEALAEHDLLRSDWDTLKATLLDHPDPAVRVDTARKPLWTVLRALGFGEKDLSGKYGTTVYRLITDERKQILLAVLAEGLSHDDKIASPRRDEPARTDGTALSMLRDCGLYMSMAVAIPPLAAWLAGADAWRRERARDFLVKYVDGPYHPPSWCPPKPGDKQGPGTARIRASEVLAGVSAIDTEEARAIARHCQTVLGLPTDSAS